jgi:hypothetical protein
MGKIKIRRIALATVFLIAATVIPLLQNQSAYATQITARSLTLQQGTDAGSKIGGVVNHYFAFTIPSVGATNVGSIQFQYCQTASGTCNMPTGMVTTSATLSAQTGATGFTITATTNGAPYITRTSASVPAGTAVTYTLSGITNPTVTAQTFYVRILTYQNAALGGTQYDAGVVAAATALQIVLTGIMPESLMFCSGATIGTTAGSVPDCSTATVSAVSFPNQFTPSSVSTAQSQLAASTNAGTGYVISVNGATMASGGNNISGMASIDTSKHGVSQFGLNLRLNTTATSNPAVGADISLTSNGTNLRGEPLAGYGTVDSFKFVSGNNIADSGQGGLGGTDGQIYTVTYIVNVPGSQPAGTYTTTLTYICTPTF